MTTSHTVHIVCGMNTREKNSLRTKFHIVKKYSVWLYEFELLLAN